VGERYRFTQDRWDLPRHRSHVAQLLSLGDSAYEHFHYTVCTDEFDWCPTALFWRCGCHGFTDLSWLLLAELFYTRCDPSIAVTDFISCGSRASEVDSQSSGFEILSDWVLCCLRIELAR